MNVDFVEYLKDFETSLNQELSITVSASNLLSAMRYSSLDGGKRVRPLLVYAAASLGDANYNDVIRVAIALELIHCYSLVHDDLPAMDDDNLRRNRPTCHIKFDESTAILAGDALQSFAFQIVSDLTKFNNQHNLLKIIHNLAHASGVLGMAGGQDLDLQNTGRIISLDDLKIMHSLKTGALIKSSIICGYLLCQNVQQNVLDILDVFANNLGLLFQITDDILDITATTEVLGKTAKKDLDNNKATYVNLLGLDTARKMAYDLYQQNIELLSKLDQSKFLLQINDKVYLRKN